MGENPELLPREAAPFCSQQNLPLSIKKSFNSCQKSLQRIQSDSPKAAPVPCRFCGNAASDPSRAQSGHSQCGIPNSTHQGLLPENLGIFTSFLWLSMAGGCRVGAEGLSLCCPCHLRPRGMHRDLGKQDRLGAEQVSATCGAAKLKGSNQFSFGSLMVTAVVWED